MKRPKCILGFTIHRISTTKTENSFKSRFCDKRILLTCFPNDFVKKNNVEFPTIKHVVDFDKYMNLLNTRANCEQTSLDIAFF